MAFITMYDTRTGAKQRSPEEWLNIFPHLSRLPNDRLPVESWTHAELDEYAVAYGVDVSAAKTKADKVVLLTTPDPAGDPEDIADAELQADD